MTTSTPASSQLLVILGTGAGQILHRLDAAGSLARAVIIEPDAVRARAFLSARDWSAWTATGRMAVVVGPDFAGADALPRQFPDLHTATLVADPALETSADAVVAGARTVLERARFDAQANADARKASAGRYLLHTLANLPRLARESNAGALEGLLAGQPAILVAAGPSLDQSRHDLASAARHGVVIACDTAARPLLQLGLDPDVIVASDPSHSNAAHLSSLPPSRAWLVGEGSLHPSAFVHFDRRTFAFRVADHQPWPWMRGHGLERAVIETWGSVVTSALSLALFMGCDPIVFLGADFAFTGGRPYCRGTSFEPMWSTWHAGGHSYDEIWDWQVGKWPDTTAPDIHGVMTRTAPHLLSFRDWTVSCAGRHPARRFVNASGAGLLHGTGIEQGRAAEALAGFPAIDRAALQRALQLAHRAGQGDPARMLAAIDAVLADDAAPERLAWRAFAGPSIVDGHINAVLRSPELAAWQAARRSCLTSEDAS